MRIFSDGRKISDKEYGHFVLGIARSSSFNKDGSFVGYSYADDEDIDKKDLFGFIFDPDKLKKRTDEYNDKVKLEFIHNVFMNEVTLLIGEKLYDVPVTEEHKVPKIIEKLYDYYKKVEEAVNGQI